MRKQRCAFYGLAANPAGETTTDASTTAGNTVIPFHVGWPGRMQQQVSLVITLMRLTSAMPASRRHPPEFAGAQIPLL